MVDILDKEGKLQVVMGFGLMVVPVLQMLMIGEYRVYVVVSMLLGIYLGIQAIHMGFMCSIYRGVGEAARIVYMRRREYWDRKFRELEIEDIV